MFFPRWIIIFLAPFSAAGKVANYTLNLPVQVPEVDVYDYTSSGLVPGCATERPFSPFTLDGLNVSYGLSAMPPTRCYLGDAPRGRGPGSAPRSLYENGTAAAVVHHNMTLQGAFVDCRDIGVHIREIAEACDLKVPEGREHGNKVNLAEGYSGPFDQSRIFVEPYLNDPQTFSVTTLRSMGNPFFANEKDFLVYFSLENAEPMVGNIRFWNGPEGWGENDPELRFGEPDLVFPEQSTGDLTERAVRVLKWLWLL